VGKGKGGKLTKKEEKEGCRENLSKNGKLNARGAK
jgi:hypothetical protein